ncbi:MAG: response regulator transcription factor [bacterium]
MKNIKAITVIKLMVVDDHPAFRKGLAALIESEPDLSVVAETGDGLESVGLYRRVRPDVVLMDLRLPGFSGVEAIQAIRKEFPDARVIVVTTYDTDEDVYRALQSGAKSYLLKDMFPEQIFDAIRAVYAGKSQLPPQVADRLDERLKRKDLTQREMDVLELLVRGLSNKEIADKLSLSEAAVKSRLKGLFHKLQVEDRAGAVISALQHGIVIL